MIDFGVIPIAERRISRSSPRGGRGRELHGAGVANTGRAADCSRKKNAARLSRDVIQKHAHGGVDPWSVRTGHVVIGIAEGATLVNDGGRMHPAVVVTHEQVRKAADARSLPNTMDNRSPANAATTGWPPSWLVTGRSVSASGPKVRFKLT